MRNKSNLWLGIPASTLGKRCIITGFAITTLIMAGCQKENKLTADTDVAVPTSLNATSSFATPPLPTRNEALVAMQVYNNTFYNNYGTYGPSYKSFYWKDENKTTRMDFWMQAEAIEMLIDAYYINPNADFKGKITYLYNGMRDGYGTLWTSNIYNDDVVWGSLMCIRAYKITNDPGMLAMAENNFNMMYTRAWDTVLGGGLWWTTAKTSKNLCVNSPAVICAMKLYDATGNVDYKNKAKLIMDWTVSKLYTTTGEVKGAMNSSGTITEGALSYTQGTFIGACNALKPYYSSIDYLGMGLKALDYTRASMCQTAGGILKDEYGNADTQGMKGIFARWACTYVNNTGTQSNYGPWLDLNASQAWSIRNSDGLMWGKWGTRTPDSTILNAFETSPGVSMVNNIYWYK